MNRPATGYIVLLILTLIELFRHLFTTFQGPP
jgi:hypothetical protein